MREERKNRRSHVWLWKVKVRYRTDEIKKGRQGEYTRKPKQYKLEKKRSKACFIEEQRGEE